MLSLIFDTETTGLPKHPMAKIALQPRIIEFGAALVDQDGEIHEQINLLINPGQPLEAIITKITGLTDADLADKPFFYEVAGQIRPLFAKAQRMIAHNLPFDSTLLDLELQRASIEKWPWPKIAVCTVQEHAEAWGFRPKLIELYQHYMKKPLEQKHRAIDDVLALRDVCLAAGVLK